jgi:hypothetical protein
MDFIFITLSNTGYIKYTLNCLKSLERIGISPKLLYTHVIGKDGYDILKQSGYECELINDESQCNFQNYQNEKWVDITTLKLNIIYENLLKYKYVCFTDGDIVFENNNFLKYLKDNIEPYDMLIQNDTCQDTDSSNLCTGFMYIKSNAKTLSIFHPATVEQSKNITPPIRDWDDQQYMNVVKSNVNYKMLPLDLFPNGQYYYYNNLNIHPYLIHFNWYIGDMKQKGMELYGKWYNETIQQNTVLKTDSKIYALSFGGGGAKYCDAVHRISRELTQINLFDKIFTYTDQDLQNDGDFWKKHGGFIKNNTRGYGFWLWKPYIILKIMQTMNNNDILIYLDAGCVVENNSITNECFNELIDKCKQHEIVYTSSYCLEKSWCKMDLFNQFNMVNNDIMNSIQHQATFLIIKKSELMMNLIEDWYNNSQNYYNIDEISILKNYILFEEHRHDQSVLSLLIKSDKYKHAVNNPENIVHNTFPFILCRHRSGDKKIFESLN